MPVSKTALLLLVVASFTIGKVENACKHTYVTFCEKISDISQEKSKESWTDLIIGSDSEDNPKEQADLMNFPWLSMTKLKSLTFLRSISSLKSTFGYQCTYEGDFQLEYLSFYGNNFGGLKSYQFPLLPLKKLSLVNNNIHEIKGWTFLYYKIDTIDASDNKIEVVEIESFPIQVKTLTLRNNQIVQLEPGCFTENLRHLNLDHNRLRNIEDGVLEHLKNLQELTLSHNKFKTMIKGVAFLKMLKILDLSFNEISNISPETFENLTQLQVLDLANNRLRTVSFLEKLLPKHEGFMEISLALNYLESGKVFANLTLGKNKLFLHGNPWDCRDWANNKNQYVSENIAECDAKFISSGQVPYCVDYLSALHPFVSERIHEQNELQDLNRASRQNFSCNLSPSKYQRFHEVTFGCVA